MQSGSGWQGLYSQCPVSVDPPQKPCLSPQTTSPVSSLHACSPLIAKEPTQQTQWTVRALNCLRAPRTADPTPHHTHLDTVLEDSRSIRHGRSLKVSIAAAVLLVQHGGCQLTEETHQGARCAADLLVLELAVCDQVLRVVSEDVQRIVR